MANDFQSDKRKRFPSPSENNIFQNLKTYSRLIHVFRLICPPKVKVKEILSANILLQYNAGTSVQNLVYFHISPTY